MCQGALRTEGRDSRGQAVTPHPRYLCRACFTENIPEPQGFISSPGDDGLPVRGHGLQRGQRALVVLQQAGSETQAEARQVPGRGHRPWTPELGKTQLGLPGGQGH